MLRDRTGFFGSAAGAHIRRVLSEAHAARAVTQRVILRAMLQCLAMEQSTDDKQVWLEKCPENELHLPEIFQQFPEARVIFNIRDPRAVYHSIKLGDPEAKPAVVGRVWSRRLTAYLDFLAGHPQLRDRFRMTRYESYVNNPDEIGDLMASLGLERPEKIVATIKGKPFKGNSFDASTNTRGKVNASKADAWRGALTADEIAEVTRTAHPGLGFAGYD
jgi:hypothetical protein